MKAFVWIMITIGLMIYVVNPIVNQHGFAWNDWLTVVNGFYNLPLGVLLFHLYKQSKFSVWPMDWVFLAIVGFTAIDFAHACRVFLLWIVTDKTMNEVLVRCFDQYNPFNCLFAILVAGAAGFLYLINLPDILHKK